MKKCDFKVEIVNKIHFLVNKIHAIDAVVNVKLLFKLWDPLTLEVPAPQNGQTHTNNSSSVAEQLFECVWPFCGLVLKGLTKS